MKLLQRGQTPLYFTNKQYSFMIYRVSFVFNIEIENNQLDFHVNENCNDEIMSACLIV